MKIWITIELFQGCIEDANCYCCEEDAKIAEEGWREREGILSDEDRQNKLQNDGTEFHIFECEVQPISIDAIAERMQERGVVEPDMQL